MLCQPFSAYLWLVADTGRSARDLPPAIGAEKIVLVNKRPAHAAGDNPFAHKLASAPGSARDVYNRIQSGW